MAQRQIESGMRDVKEFDHGESRIHVVTAYEIRSDSWPFHVYVGLRGHVTHKVGGVGEARSPQEACDLGFEAGRMFLDATA